MLLFSDVALSGCSSGIPGRTGEGGTRALGVQGYFLSRDQWDNVQIAIGSSRCDHRAFTPGYFPASMRLVICCLLLTGLLRPSAIRRLR